MREKKQSITSPIKGTKGDLVREVRGEIRDKNKTLNSPTNKKQKETKI